MSIRILVPTQKDFYELGELARMFLPAGDLCMEAADGPRSAEDPDFTVRPAEKEAMKRQLYGFLRARTGKALDWGILIGVKPVKLYRKLLRRTGSEEAAEAVLRNEYYVSDARIALLRRIARVQAEALADSGPGAVGIYVGIPFCPTRCLYCSFTSNPYSRQASDAYLAALRKEIAAVRGILDRKGWHVESIYVGGGTPTSLDEDQLALLLGELRLHFAGDRTKEFTVEAGRPDTITEGKLTVIREAGAGRISINPQSMKEETLRLIGRSHTPEQIRKAFALAKHAGIPCINADLIAGLPEESPEDFGRSLREVMALGPSNITVHTLAVKRASRLIEEDAQLAVRQADNVARMLEDARRTLSAAGYEPYYLYRQKHMAGNFENVGYCTKGSAGVYNIRIMEEDQSVLALGAGGISKLYFSAEDRIERIANVSNYQIYIDRIDEMIERKVTGIQ